MVKYFTLFFLLFSCTFYNLQSIRTLSDLIPIRLDANRQKNEINLELKLK